MGKELKMLVDFGANKIKFDSLANNYYIDFVYNSKKYTVGHILSVYGEPVDYWEFNDKTFESLEDILECLKKAGV